MKAIELYRFIKENNVEWHRDINDGIPDVVIFPMMGHMPYLISLFSSQYLTDENLNCIIKDGYFSIWMDDVCEYHGIALDEVFIGKSWDSDN